DLGEVGGPEDADDAERDVDPAQVGARPHAPVRVGVVDGGLQRLTGEELPGQQPQLEGRAGELALEPAVGQVRLLAGQGDELLAVLLERLRDRLHPPCPCPRARPPGRLVRPRSGKSMRTVLAMTAVGAVALAGCSGGDGDGDGGGGSGPTTLTFAASTFGEPGRGPGLEAWLEEFNSSQDDVVVEPAVVPFPTFGQTVLTQMGAGEGPDLVRFDMPEFASAADAGLLEPIDELVDLGQFDLFEAPDQYMFANDTRYGVIFEASN